jgi:hypothetical protein
VKKEGVDRLSKLFFGILLGGGVYSALGFFFPSVKSAVRSEGALVPDRRDWRVAIAADSTYAPGFENPFEMRVGE